MQTKIGTEFGSFSLSFYITFWSLVSKLHTSSNISSFRRVDNISIPHELEGTGIVDDELPLRPEKLDILEKLGRLVKDFLSILSVLDIRWRNFIFESSGAD